MHGQPHIGFTNIYWCSSWIIKCLNVTDSRCNHEDSTAVSLSITPYNRVSPFASSTRSSAYFTVWVTCPPVLNSSTRSRTSLVRYSLSKFNPLMPNDPYTGRTAPPTSKSFILYIYSKNIGTEYFKQYLYSPFFSLQNAVCFIILTYLVPALFTFLYGVC